MVHDRTALLATRVAVALIAGVVIGVAGCRSTATPVAPIAAPAAPAPAQPLPPSASRLLPRAGVSAVSVSFISSSTGWVLAQVGGCPGACRAAVLRTEDGGRSWRRLKAPKETALRGVQRAGAVDGIHFVNRRDGWLYGGDLWFTHDGGHRWMRALVAPFKVQGRIEAGATVESLAVAGSTVYVVGAACDTAGQGCEFGRLYQAPIGARRLHNAPGLPRFGEGGGFFSGSVTVADNAVLLQEAHEASPLRLYALTPEGWVTRVDPCAANSGLYGSLAAAGSRGLLAVCTASDRAGALLERAYRSVDGGLTWRRLADPPARNGASAIGTASARRYVVATGRGRIDVSRDGGAHWSTRRFVAHPRSGWVEISFVTRRLGFAIPGVRNGSLLRTTNGGRTWRDVPLAAR